MITYYQTNLTINYNFGSTPYLVPSDLYIGISSEKPLNDGSNILEPSGNNYSRVHYYTGTDYWTESTFGVLENSQIISFPESSAAWGTINYIFISDAPTLGNILYYGTLPESIYIENNTTLKFEVGDFNITLIVTQ